MEEWLWYRLMIIEQKKQEKRFWGIGNHISQTNIISQQKETSASINTKGYYHIIIPSKVNINGKFAYYQIIDYLLTKDNMLKECSRYGKYNNIEDLAKAMETDLER